MQLLMLFETLSTHPELCESVKSLGKLAARSQLTPDIRFFPLDMQGESRSVLEDMISASLEHMHNLVRLVWTVSLTPSAALSDRRTPPLSCSFMRRLQAAPLPSVHRRSRAHTSATAPYPPSSSR